MKAGCYTAIATPFLDDGAVDYDGLDQLAEFQIQNRITGIVAVGTTGESPVLSWDEHNKVIVAVAQKTKDRCLCIAGTGSNNTAESLAASNSGGGSDLVLAIGIDVERPCLALDDLAGDDHFLTRADGKINTQQKIGECRRLGLYCSGKSAQLIMGFRSPFGITGQSR